MSINLDIQLNSAGAANRADQLIVDSVKSFPDLVLGLATGSTPEETYGEIVRQYEGGKVSFAKVQTFNLDEYWGLDGDHEQSYRYFMQTRLFDHIDVRPWNTHVLNGRAANAAVECEAYEKKIQACGGVDLWLLGIGQNGHIAFNEPGSTVDSRTRMVCLTPSTIAANSDGRFFSDPKDVPRCALTAGIATIREARHLILLATGEKKADAVAAAVEGDFTEACPASLLQDHQHVTFVLDKAAASKLKNRTTV